MKKLARAALAVCFVFGILLTSTPQSVSAKKNPFEVTPQYIAEGTWQSGTETDVSSSVADVPGWLQLLTNGVKLTEAGKICHPFRGGQFGWVGKIMQYKDGKWTKLTTTTEWTPDKEGTLLVCAEAPEAGVYSLFGYYSPTNK